MRFAGARAFGLAAFLLPLTLFVASMSSEPMFWDTAEMQGVPYILGIAHPTGFPLYTLLGYIFSHLVFLGTVAFRLNLLSALCVSGACLFLYWTARDFSIPRVCAVLASLWFAVTGVVWLHAIRAEVHDLALLLCAAATCFLLRWVRAGNERALVYGISCVGLALATHPLAVLIVPGMCVALIVRRPSWQTLGTSAAIFAACALLYAYLPLRSFLVQLEHLDPSAHLAGLHGGLFWNYNNPSTRSGLWTELTGSQFGAGHALFSAFGPTTLQGYFWEWLQMVVTQYGAFGLAMAFVGLSRLWSREWKTTLCLLLLTLAAIPFSYAYGVEGDPDRYRLLALWLIPLLMAGVAADTTRFDVQRFVRVGIVLFLMTLWGTETLRANWLLIDTRNSAGNRPLITALGRKVPSGSIIMTRWFDATSLAYAAYVDRSLDGRIIVAGWATDYTASSYTSWAHLHPLYYIDTVRPPDVSGVRFLSFGVLDSTHTLWRIVPGY